MLSRCSIRGYSSSSTGAASPAARMLQRMRTGAGPSAAVSAPKPPAAKGRANEAATDPLSARFASASGAVGHGSAQTGAKVANSGSVVSHFTRPMSEFLDGIVALHASATDSITLLATYWAKSERAEKRVTIRMVLRTLQDLKVILPATFYMGLPFKMYTLPTVFRLLPGLVPSSFYTRDVMAIKAKVVEEKRTAAALGIMEAISKQVDQLDRVTDKSTVNAIATFKKLLMNPAGVAYADLNPLFFPLFASRLTASATLAKPDVFASFLNLTFPAAVPRPRLLQWADWILKDDFMIRREGVRDMTPFELVEALEERGYTRLSDLSLDAMREMLLAHSRFTKMLMDTIVSKRANETAVVYEDEYAVVPTVSSHLGLTPEELGGVATLLIFARALGVRG